MKTRRAKLVVVALAGAMSAGGCNLVLGIEEGQPRSEPAGDDGAAESSSTRPARCVRDADCPPPNACYTGHCDTVLGACTYVECEAKDRACAAGTCDTTTNTCSEAKDYGFRTTSYRIANATLGCGASPDDCVAAIHPFVFIGTRDDAIAVRVSGLVAPTATTTPIAGATIRPSQLVASGRRLWIVGAPQGTAPPYRLPIVTIDVPASPTVAKLDAELRILDYRFPTAKAFPAVGGDLFLVHDDPAQGLPVALLRAPLPERGTIGVANPGDAGADASAPGPPPTIPMYRLASAPAGASVAASSGARLVVYRAGIVDVVASPGTPEAALGADQPLVPPLSPFQPPLFAQGPDGVVLLGAPVNADALTPSGPDCNCNARARAAWILPNATAASIDANVALDAEGWTNPQIGGQPCHTCTGGYFAQRVLTTWIDARTALVATPGGAPETRGLTSVRVVSRDPLAAPPKRRALTAPTEDPPGNFAVDRVALTSAAGFGHLVVSDAEGNKVNLSIFDPRCDAK